MPGGHNGTGTDQNVRSMAFGERKVLGTDGDVIEIDTYAMYSFSRCNGYTPIYKKRFRRLELEPIGRPVPP